MNTLSLRRTLTLAAITFAGLYASAAPALAATTDGTSNTIMVAAASGPKLTPSFQGGCSKSTDTCPTG